MANQKVTREQIEAAAERFGGCVEAMAEDLDITRKALYERLKRTGLFEKLGFYRSTSRVMSGERVHTVSTFGVSVARVDSLNSPVPETESDYYRNEGAAPSLDGIMERGAAAAADNVVAMAVRRRQQQAPRWRPEDAEAVADFRIRYQPKVGYETTNSAIFAQFFAEAWPEWAAKKMAEPKR